MMSDHYMALSSILLFFVYAISMLQLYLVHVSIMYLSSFSIFNFFTGTSCFKTSYTGVYPLVYASHYFLIPCLF